MPFVYIKRGPQKGKYRSPSGRVMTKEQIRAYNAKKTEEKKKKSK